jgi:hypothetical protein
MGTDWEAGDTFVVVSQAYSPVMLIDPDCQSVITVIHLSAITGKHSPESMPN